jgi:hypothetical protein
MAEKIVNLIEGVTTPLTGVGPLIKLQSKLAQDPPPPNTVEGTHKGNTPYRQAVLTVRNAAGTVAIYTVKRPNPRMAGVGADGGAENAQAIQCDGTAYQYLTKFDYAAWALHNWIVELNGVVLTFDATPADLTQYKVNDVGGVLQIEIGDGDPVPEGEITVINATPLKATILSDALNGDVHKVVNPHDYVYLEATAGEPSVADLEFYYR